MLTVQIGDTRATILAEIQAFRAETGMKESTIGRGAVRSPGLLKRLEAGQSITIDTLDALRVFMAKERLKRAG